MAIHLIKIRPRPDHFHKDNQVVCERCMSRLASSGSPLIDELAEYSYVTQQLSLITMHTIVESMREGIYIANEILLILAKFVLFVSLGIGAFVAANFPAVAGGKSAYEEELDSRYKAKKQKDWERLEQDKKAARAHDAERDEYFNAHLKDLNALKKRRLQFNDSLAKQWKKKVEDAIARDNAELDEYDKNRQLLNSAPWSTELRDVHTDMLKDELLVKEINNTLKGVESGTEDPEKLRKISEELIKQRQDKAQKDARRTELLNKYKDKNWEANKLHADADRAFKRQEYDVGESLAGRAQSAESEAKGLYNEYLSV